MEHYEIARYGSMLSWVQGLKMLDVADVLGTILGEEQEADERLMEFSETRMNQAAIAESGTAEAEGVDAVQTAGPRSSNLWSAG